MLPLNAPFQIVAHAGCMGTPDDSLESVGAAVREGAHVVEIDVRFAPDGIPVISHDPLRPTRQAERVEAAFAVLAAHPAMRVNLDLKEPRRPAPLEALLTRAEFAARSYLTGLKPADVAAVRPVCNEVPYCVDFPALALALRGRLAPQGIVAQARRLGAFALNLDYRRVTPALAAACRDLEMPLHVWTVDDEADMHRMIAWGARSITTRRVDVLARLLDSRRRGRSRAAGSQGVTP